MGEGEVCWWDVWGEGLGIGGMNIKGYGEKVSVLCGDIVKEEVGECEVEVVVSKGG